MGLTMKVLVWQRCQQQVSLAWVSDWQYCQQRGSQAWVTGNLAVGFQLSGASQFPPKPTVKIERPVWGKFCVRVAELRVLGEIGMDGSWIHIGLP
jgi:hypothetical protein